MFEKELVLRPAIECLFEDGDFIKYVYEDDAGVFLDAPVCKLPVISNLRLN